VTTTLSNTQQQRKEALSLLSRSERHDIEKYWLSLALTPSYKMLKQPEIGMVMVKAKASGTDQAFNMGEMTTTRCVVQLDSGQLGYGYTAGRDKKKSELIALIDACFQSEEHANLISEKLLIPLEEQLHQQYQSKKENIESSKVNFFTMVRGA